MVKRKLAAIMTAAIAACSIATTAFATTNGVPKYSFGPATITPYAVPLFTEDAEKEDAKDAWVNVDYGLSSGYTFATVRVKHANSRKATEDTDLWRNGEHYIEYLPGQGIEGFSYYLEYYMEPQANASRIFIKGIWAP